MVFWPTEMYIQETQMEDTRYNQKLPSDPTSAKSYNIITKQEFDFMTVQHPIVLTFYLLPKIHKSLTISPGKPIVVGIRNICEKPAFLLTSFYNLLS